MASYQNPWLLDDIPFETRDIYNFNAFVYLLTDIENGKRYIGFKNFYSYTKPKNSKRKIKLESNWKQYYSSSKIVKQIVKTHGIYRFKREILRLTFTSGEARFFESKIQFENGVLLKENRDNFYNECIGKFRTFYQENTDWKKQFLEDVTNGRKV